MSAGFESDKPYIHLLKIPPPMGRTTAFFYGTLMIPYEVDRLIINFTLIDLSSTVSEADIGRL